jgi:hypothetical protein
MESVKKKFICEKCQFTCITKSKWTIHIGTEKHINGKKKSRSDKIYPCKCQKCDFIATNKSHMLQHFLTFHATKSERKEQYKFYCEYCDFGTFTKNIFDKHNTSNKHTKYIEINSQ